MINFVGPSGVSTYNQQNIPIVNNQQRVEVETFDDFDSIIQNCLSYDGTVNENNTNGFNM